MNTPCAISAFHRSEDPGMTNAQEADYLANIQDELEMLIQEVPAAALFESAINDDRTTTALESLIKHLATYPKLSSQSTDLQLKQVMLLVSNLQSAINVMTIKNYSDQAERAYIDRLSL